MAAKNNSIARPKKDPLVGMYDRLLVAFGPRNWWPAETPFEVMVGAVLTRNTAWSNVEKAVANLKAAGLMYRDFFFLYAAGKPAFVIDAYTRRVLKRHGLIEGDELYDLLQLFCTDRLPKDVDLYNEFHVLLVNVGHRHCRTKPLCEGCPLENFPAGDRLTTGEKFWRNA